MMKYLNQGPVYGIVCDNADPDGLGRVKVSLQAMGDTIVTNWIPVLSLYSGAFFIPEIDDQVVVCFMGGSMDEACVIGGIWSDNQPPPVTDENTASDLNQDGENNLRFIRSRSGHRIILDDKAGEEKIQVISADGGTRFEFLAASETINITSNIDLTLEAKGKLNVKAEEGDFQFTKNLKIQSDQIVVESKDQNVSVKAGKNLALKGNTVTLN